MWLFRVLVAEHSTHVSLMLFLLGMITSEMDKVKLVDLIYYPFLFASFRWSLGAIMYEMLVGYPPFYSEDPITTCRKVKWSTQVCANSLSSIKNSNNNITH